VNSNGRPDDAVSIEVMPAGSRAEQAPTVTARL